MLVHLDRFVGKVAVVTGASAGIGVAIVEELVKTGVIVAGLARRVERIQDQAKRLKGELGKVYGFKCDLTIESDIKNTFEKIINELGDIHILINNAGIMLPTNLVEGDSQKWRTIIDTNVLALCIATREAVQNMKLKGTMGHIVHINSIAGHRVINMPGINVYGASKFAVTALTATLINDFSREMLPIKVSSISPGYVKTEFEEVAEISAEFLPPYALSAHDVAEAVLFALSTPPHVNVTEIMVEPLIARQMEN